MATRNERVRLDLEDHYTQGVLKAAAATKILDKSLNDLSGHAVGTSKDLDKPADSTKKVGDSARRAGPNIDRFSGRLATLARAAVVLGPALVPLGAATIPVLTASLAGLGAAAGGIGTAVLAFKGIGEAIESIDAYRAESTAENLQAMRLELEKVGPVGAEFARTLANLEPGLRQLQNVARAGSFPGITEGIEDLLTRGPQVTRIISELAQGLGDLGADAGVSLGGSDFDAFFDYLETDARPTLEAFGRSVGNLALGVANMLVAFGPLSGDVSGGLESMTKAFAEWSKSLDSNTSFQGFLNYLRESGPQAVDFLGAMAKALAGLAEAAAPFGQAVLPALTGLARVFSAIAASPIGPGLYTAVAAMIAFKRATDLGTKAFDSFTKSSQKPVSNLGRIAGLAAGVAGTALAVGAMTDNMNRIDPANLERSLTALSLGNVTDDIDKVVSSIEEVTALRNSVDFGEILHLGGDTSLDRFADNIDLIDQKLASLVETGEQAQAAFIFEEIAKLAEAKGVDPSKTADQFDAYSLALSNVATEAERAAALSTLLVGPINDTGNALDSAASGAEAFSGALSKLNGWFDKRDAIRGYKDSIDALRKSLRDGFTREDAANLDAVGRSMLQVAEQIKNPQVRADFLAGARQSMLDLARNSGPKAQAAIAELIAKMDELGLTEAKPKITADDRRAKQSAEDIKTEWGYLDKLTSKPKVNADVGNSLTLLQQVQQLMNSINGRVSTATIRVNRIGPSGTSVTSTAGGHSQPAPGETPAPGRVAGDRGGSNRGNSGNDKSDDFFGLIGGRISGSRPDGGLSTGGGSFASGGLNGLGAAANNAAYQVQSLGTVSQILNRSLKEQQSLYDTAKSNLEAAQGRRDSISSGIQSGLAGDLWEKSAGSVWSGGGVANPIAAANARIDRTRRFVAALNTLRQKGVTGPALLEIIGTGDVERAEAMASLPIEQLGTFSSTLNTANAELAAAGLAGGNAIEGQNIAEWKKATADELKELREIKAELRLSRKAASDDADRNAQYVSAGVNGAAGRGHRRGKNGGGR